ncbi:hypothetical protein CYLTODRAFT_352929 [Cylindrobasidium torrendii FP15055 ss-10]|uniref:C2H2-type domain-containing protein n=1 Tax=Cylindrobasidium torrendii FP15055 ss-10 TaxID=1314674 RepID=A0A0D7BBG6_9AGAR|nr:hypothetical protein CYLTODRAFT_352929 [Cylindrobasidium torrendii FP15055 ss-10]
MSTNDRNAFLDGFDYPEQPQPGMDFFSYQNPADVLAPHPDLFESELDSSLAGLDDQLEVFTVDTHDAFSYYRSETPKHGPRSVVTEDSRSSAYDSELYAPSYAHTQYSFPLDLEMDFQRIGVGSDYDFSSPLDQRQALHAPQPQASSQGSPLDFGSLPPTPPLSPPRAQQQHVHQKHHYPRTAFSDYGPPSRNVAPNYYSYVPPISTIAPNNVSGHLQSHGAHPMAPPAHPDDQSFKQDGRKKYQCPNCPRAFARAYNLKTHMATHDPNRLKPHVCPHRACGRSFSRKHDLGRHIISIHRDDAASVHSASSKKSIGVDGAKRVWCSTCGKPGVGRAPDCGCDASESPKAASSSTDEGK